MLQVRENQISLRANALLVLRICAPWREYLLLKFESAESITRNDLFLNFAIVYYFQDSEVVTSFQ